ncbi:MAG: PadR family transcriptional regulator [Caldisphaeraceae archaeon]|nr:PadR family transcriptional regulator [Caldisphaeraceae archaeon]
MPWHSDGSHWSQRRGRPNWVGTWKHRGWLRPIILFLLSKKPLNGVEIMNEVQYMTYGYWRPSPGSLYPILYELVREGLVERRSDNRYVLTEDGKDFINSAWSPIYTPSDPRDALDRINVYLDVIEERLKEGRDDLLLYKKRLSEIRDRIDVILSKLA